jgi:hypothetical protein
VQASSFVVNSQHSAIQQQPSFHRTIIVYLRPLKVKTIACRQDLAFRVPRLGGLPSFSTPFASKTGFSSREGYIRFVSFF